MTLEELGKRLQFLEDREAIRELVARYGQVVDDRDIEGVRALFTEDAVFRTKGGEMNAVGVAEVMDNFRSRFKAMTASGHFVHDHIIGFQSDRAAHGYVTSHAELVRNGESFLVAMRYQDQYLRFEDGWKFSEREVSFFYYLPTDRYPELLPQRARVCGYGDPIDADWPEGTDSYQRYERILGSE